MHKIVVNRVQLDLRIRPRTPLLIKAGDKGATLLHPEMPDLLFVRTGSRDEDETVYIPGSSLKGVVRSASERVLRTLGVDCCDPLSPDSRCQRDAGRRGDELARRGGSGHVLAPVHAEACYACRTFGSQAIASRVAFSDALPPADLRARTNATERRSGVSIDRRTGGPSHGRLFEQEVVTGGAFDTAVHLTNVQLWQVALVGIVLRDAQAGFVRFGSSKSRGLGHVDVEPRGVVFEQTDPAGRRAAPAGIAALQQDLVTPYGLLPAAGDALDGAVGGDATPTPMGRRFTYAGVEAAWRLLDACAGAPWRAFCDGARRAPQ